MNNKQNKKVKVKVTLEYEINYFEEEVIESK